MASRDFIFRVSLEFDDSFSKKSIGYTEKYINYAISETYEDEMQDRNGGGVDHEVVLDGNVLSLYLSQKRGENKWDSETLNGVVCGYFISLFLDTMMVLLPATDDYSLKILGMTKYQYLKGITVTSSVNNEILMEGSPDEKYIEDASYVAEWVLNSVPLYSNLTVSNSDLSEEITDDVMFTTQTVQEYFEEDKNNRILYTPVVRDGNMVKRSWSVLQKDFLDDRTIVEGSKRYGCFILDTRNPKNVDSENTLVDLQAFGSYNMWVQLDNFEASLLDKETLNPEDHPAFAVIPTFTKYASLVNVDVQDSGASAVSRYHCQDTGRKVIKVHKIVPTYMEPELKRSSCITTDKVFRMKMGAEGCLPGLKNDEASCCRTSNQDLLETLVLLSAYRTVDFPARLNYLKDILSWYSTIRPIPSPWKNMIKLSVAEELPRDNKGVLDVINTLKPSVMSAVISVKLTGDETKIAKQLSETIKSLNTENMHYLKLSFKPTSRKQELSNVIFEDIMKTGKYPMGYLRTIMSWSDESISHISTVCKNIMDKERYEMKIDFVCEFKRDRTLTDPDDIDAEDIEADATMDAIKEKIEETFRNSGYKQKLVISEDQDSEEEPYRREHVEVQILTFWHTKEQRIMQINFECESKLKTPRTFK
jgi:hypothetical protein